MDRVDGNLLEQINGCNWKSLDSSTVNKYLTNSSEYKAIQTKNRWASKVNEKYFTLLSRYPTEDESNILWGYNYSIEEVDTYIKGTDEYNKINNPIKHYGLKYFWVIAAALYFLGFILYDAISRK